MKKHIVLSLTITILLLANIVTATTATIGNSRMVLRMELDETIEKYILVKNVNDFPVSINLEAQGDLVDSIIIKESDFELLPKEEKRAVFSLKATKTGTSESRINVGFNPENGSKVGLTSTIIVIVSGESEDQESDFETLESDEDNLDEDFMSDSVNEDNPTSPDSNSDSNTNPKAIKEENKSSKYIILTIVTISLISVLVILYILANSRTKQKKRVFLNE